MSAYPSDQRCPRCQYLVPPGAANCPNCGMALTSGGYPPPPSGSGNSYGTLPSSDPYGSPPGSGGGSNYGGQPPTLYSGSGSMNNAPTVQTPLYPQSSGGWGSGQSQPPSYPPPPPGYTSTQPQADFGAPPSYPGAAPAYPGSQPQGGFGAPPSYPGTAPAYPGSQPQGGFGGGFSPPPGPPPMQQATQRSGNGLRIAIIALVVVILLGGGGTAAYLLTRPNPVITVKSSYSVGTTPAGAAGTTLQITGQKFSGNSSITFLVDGQQAPGAQAVESDNSGNVTATLTITKDWADGQRTITAKDASGYATQSGVPVEIVDPGKSNTPGPNGSPSNNASFSLNVTITSQVLGTAKETLIITGKGDSGGTVCQTQDDGNHTITSPGTLTFGDGTQLDYSEASTFSCSGSYVGGHLTYTETTVTDVWTFSGGTQCHANPHKAQIISGDFSDAKTISGTFSADSFSLQDCNYKGNPVNIDADKGSFTGTVNS